MTTAEARDLRSRIAAFELDEPGAALSFSKRLARDNGWTHERALRVIEEYRRFVYLTVAAGHPVTPSIDVDEAWHLHLTYTRSYWERLCGEVLGRPLHHEPTKGGPREGTKFVDWYARSLASYEEHFGEKPPADIWPPPAERFDTRSRPMRVTQRTHLVVPRARLQTIALAAVAALLAAVAIGCATEMPSGFATTVIFSAFATIAVVALLSRLSKSRGSTRRRRRTRGSASTTSAPDGYVFFDAGGGTSRELDTGGGDADGGHDGGSAADSSGGDSGCSGCGGCGGGD